MQEIITWGDLLEQLCGMSASMLSKPINIVAMADDGPHDCTVIDLPHDVHDTDNEFVIDIHVGELLS